MSQIRGIITEEINKVVINNQISKIEKYLSDLETMNLSSYGNEIINFSQKLENLGWSVVNASGSKVTNFLSKLDKKRRFRFNPSSFSRALSNYGFKLPNEGLTNNVYNNTIETYNWVQDKINTLRGNGNQGNQQQNNDFNNKVKKIKNIMGTTWPQIFSEYANIVSRYRYVLQKTPTIVSLVKELETLYSSIK